MRIIILVMPYWT